MSVTIALVGNPNSGKTTLFNALTGANQFVGNWPGVTVEKKEGRLKGRNDVAFMDLPGIYSLSPYTPEEVVARSYLINQRPDAILNIVDGTNIERNLYLTTQIMELGIPVVMAVNMMDVVNKNGDIINTKQLEAKLGCPVVEISALKGTNVDKAAEKAVQLAKSGAKTKPMHSFEAKVEGYLGEIESRLTEVNEDQRRFYAIKLFERDDKINVKTGVSDIVERAEKEMDDDSESIITNQRYDYITSIIKSCYKKKNNSRLSVSDKIDRIVTNRILALPIFAVVMFIVYYVSVTTVGAFVTDWTNDGLFGDGWFMFGSGREAYDAAVEEFEFSDSIIAAFEGAAAEAGVPAESAADITVGLEIYDDDGNVEVTDVDYELYMSELSKAATEPDPADYGPWVPGIPVLIENLLGVLNCADWLSSLILDGIVAGVGAVLGFVPQMLVLFIFLAFLEGCGYMARIAFIMDRIFRRFGLSGKSFIPMLIGSGCGVPGIMASRTIENERDRRMTIMTTTFIPCGAKLPIIALIAGSLFGGAGWVGASAYFVGALAIVISGIILKKTKMFEGDPAPFVMELPAYHLPTAGSVLRSMWERGWSFIKKAGTIILISTIFVWFTSNYGFANGHFGAVDELADQSILGRIGSAIAWVFTPLGWGDWRAAVAAVTGLVAKENVVGTLGILYGAEVATESGSEIWASFKNAFTVTGGGAGALAAYSFMLFNLLCAPCFAAIGAIRREMNSSKWTWFAIGYQCVFAYFVALCIFQIGRLITAGVFGAGTLAAFIIIALVAFLLVRPAKLSSKPSLEPSVN
ncbi:MAG: ferrous iron transport protein B [Oscillospiraceae bacterium]|nr:ferrous iron transport protein B [Oscillospiraceae bacterium]